VAGRRITTGPVFRRSTATASYSRAVSVARPCLDRKRHAGAAGLDSAKLAGHSLRAGLATAAAIAGARERAIMNQTGHRNSAMFHRYVRDASLFRENAAAVVGL